MRCDCCGGTFVDEVGLMLVLEAAVTFRESLRAKHARDAAAWEEAQVATQVALRQARA